MPERYFQQPNEYYPHLFEPGYIGNLRIKNRIVMPPMGTHFASAMGEATERTVRHYARRAEGGVGLIIVEFTCVDYPQGKGHACQLSLHDNKLISSHTYLTEAVHKAGAKISIQLHHAGPNSDMVRTEGLEPVSPGLIPSREVQDQPRILRASEIPALVEKFAQAVQRAKLAGYDSVELHGAHGYLMSAFMSPYINNRTDEWGGTLEKRMRFPLEVIRRSKELVGDSFPITMRISAVEFVPGGREIEETKQVARMLEQAGLVGLHVSASVDTDYDWAADPIYAPLGRKVHLAAAIKEAVNIPVIAVGVIREPAFAESVIAAGKADFVAIGRGVLADPDWPNKAAAGAPDTIRKCFSCNYCDGTRNPAAMSIRCVVNLELGQGDSAWDLEFATDKKKVMVVGGGPAGIETARVAALRGHDVTLFEKGPRLGGQLLLAAKAPDKDKIEWLIETLTGGLASSAAAVKLGVDVTAHTVEEFSPDVLVLATGGEPLVPNIPGIDGGSVTTAWSVIDGHVPAAKRFVVIGGSSTGCETAILLASLSVDTEVVLIEQLSALASDMEMNARQTIRRQISEAPNINGLVGWKVTSISPEGVVATGPGGGSRVYESEATVLAAGVKPFAPLLDELTTVTPPPSVYTVGDSSKPGTIASALFDARVLAAWI